MRRPALVKPFFGRVNRASDCRPTGGTSNLQSFLLRKVFFRLSMVPIADQREARKAAIPILKSPNRPTSIRTLGGAIAPVPAGGPQLEMGAAVSEPN